jgi:hypothetical protein
MTISVNFLSTFIKDEISNIFDVLVIADILFLLPLDNHITDMKLKNDTSNLVVPMEI